MLVLALLLASCASTRQPCPCEKQTSPADTLSKATFLPDSFTYVDPGCGFRLTLPHMPGWMAGRPAEGMSRAVVYAAIHLGRLVNVVLSVEPLNGETPDYLYLIRRANRFEKRLGYRDLGIDAFPLAGTQATRFIYRAEVEQEKSSDEEEDSVAADDLAAVPEDSLAVDELPEGETTPYIYTNVLLTLRHCNLWLEVSTPEEAYGRKKAFLEEVVRGLSAN